jgi:hypothetical protein
LTDADNTFGSTPEGLISLALDAEAEATQRIESPEHLEATESTEATDGGTEGVRQGGKLKGGFDAAEAARLRWAKQRARDAEASDLATHERQHEVVVVRTTVATGAILKRLERDAKQGSTQAARELRAWLSDLPIETDTDMSALDKRTRQALLARLLEEVEEREGHAARALDQEAAEEGEATPPSGGTPVA